jgi:ion channel-forming bestrophin family protein
LIVRQDLPLSRLLHFVANRIVLFFLIDILISVAYVIYGVKWVAIPELPVALIGTGLTIFLGFRIKAAYDRWWEARILWGGLVNWSRSMARRCQIFTSQAVDLEEEESIRGFQQQFVYWLIAYVYALRSHLREHDPLFELKQWIGEEGTAQLQDQQNIPAAILVELGAWPMKPSKTVGSIHTA